MNYISNFPFLFPLKYTFSTPTFTLISLVFLCGSPFTTELTKNQKVTYSA